MMMPVLLSVLFLASADPAIILDMQLGGRGVDDCNDIAVDSAGMLYLACHANSPDFPGAPPKAKGLDLDAIAVKLDPANGKVLWASRIGGTDYDSALRLRLDAAGNLYLTGMTKSADFPVTPDAQQRAYGGGDDAFLVKLDPQGRVLYATYFGGPEHEEGMDLLLGKGGEAYIVGSTKSRLEGARAVGPLGKQDGFVARIGAGGWILQFGGSEDEKFTGLELDPRTGELIVAGYTASRDAVIRRGKALGGPDAVVLRIAPDGKLQQSARFGGSDQDSAWGLQVDPSGDVYLAGTTTSKDLEIPRDMYQRNLQGAADVFVARLRGSDFKPIWTTYFGGGGVDQAGYDGHSLALRPNGELVIAGITSSDDLPLVDPAQAKYGSAERKGFLAIVAAGGARVRYSTFWGLPAERTLLDAVALGTEGRIYFTGLASRNRAFDAVVGGVQVLESALRSR
jgi:hypothetical protein